MLSRLQSAISVFVTFISFSSGLTDFYDVFPTYTSNLDPFYQTMPAPQWDALTNLGLPPTSVRPAEYCEPFPADVGNRGKRSISIYYPPAILPPITTWSHCSIPQILTIDSSMLAKPIDYASQKLPVFIQMLELPRSAAEAASNACEPEKTADLVKPLIEAKKEEVAGLLQAAETVVKEKKALEEAVAKKILEKMMLDPELETTTSSSTPGSTVPEPVSEEMPPATTPPDLEKDAEMIDSVTPANDAPQKMSLLVGGSGCPINPEANRCFIETISQPHVNYFTYELQLPN